MPHKKHLHVQPVFSSARILIKVDSYDFSQTSSIDNCKTEMPRCLQVKLKTIYIFNFELQIIANSYSNQN